MQVPVQQSESARHAKPVATHIVEQRRIFMRHQTFADARGGQLGGYILHHRFGDSASALRAGLQNGIDGFRIGKQPTHFIGNRRELCDYAWLVV